MNYTIQHYHDAPAVAEGLDAKVMYTSDLFEMVHLTLRPGDGLEPHAMPFEVVFFVREGSGTLFVDPDELTGLAGDCISVKAGIRRGWKNTGSSDLKLIVMKILR